jgi:hypothetical protein
MADNFNLNKFIRNNPLLKESIGGYRDIKPMKEMDYELEKPENIYADEEGESEMYGRAWGLAGQQLKSAIDALRQDGFDDEDIKNFLMTGIDMYDQVFGDYDDLEEAEGLNEEEYTVDFGTNTMTYTLDRANNVLKGLKPAVVPGSARQEDLIPVTIDKDGYLSTTDRRVKDISPKSNKNPFSDPGYMNRD